MREAMIEAKDDINRQRKEVLCDSEEKQSSTGECSPRG